MITPTFSIEDKQAEVQRIATVLDDRRLDWSEAISVAIDAMTKFKPSYQSMTAREVLRILEPERFLHVKMQTLCVRAMALLMSEYTAP